MKYREDDEQNQKQRFYLFVKCENFLSDDFYEEFQRINKIFVSDFIILDEIGMEGNIIWFSSKQFCIEEIKDKILDVGTL
jgi:hypothetical protein